MSIDILIPDSWDKLSQKQLKIVFSFLASDSLSLEQCKLLIAFKLAGIKFYGIHEQGALIRYKGVFIVLDDNDLLEIAKAVDFIDSEPSFPVRLFEIKFRKAVHPLLRELSFSQWLAIENLYCGFLVSKDISLLNEILSILYPKAGLFNKLIKSFKAKKLNFAHINVIKWLAAFKNYLARNYGEIYRRLDDDEDSKGPAISRQLLLESMNAQIRALTKGDITKQEAVLAMDVHTALSELNALALEARKLNEALKKK